MDLRDYAIFLLGICVLVMTCGSYLDVINNRRMWKAIISIAKNCDAVDMNEVAAWSCLTNHIRISNENFKLVEQDMKMNRLQKYDLYPPSTSNNTFTVGNKTYSLTGGIIVELL